MEAAVCCLFWHWLSFFRSVMWADVHASPGLCVTAVAPACARTERAFDTPEPESGADISHHSLTGNQRVSSCIREITLEIICWQTVGVYFRDYMAFYNRYSFLYSMVHIKIQYPCLSIQTSPLWNVLTNHFVMNVTLVLLSMYVYAVKHRTICRHCKRFCHKLNWLASPHIISHESLQTL